MKIMLLKQRPAQIPPLGWRRWWTCLSQEQRCGHAICTGKSAVARGRGLRHGPGVDRELEPHQVWEAGDSPPHSSPRGAAIRRPLHSSAQCTLLGAPHPRSRSICTEP